MRNRLQRLFTEELLDLHLRLRLAYAFAFVLPKRAGGRCRVSLLRLAGLRIGNGTIMFGMPTILAGEAFEAKLTIGKGCWLNVGCTFDVHDRVEVGDEVYFGQEVMVLTQSHQIGTPDRRAGPLQNKPITIGDGAWIGARACILPGVNIGRGSIVGAGAVVTHDVAADTVVAGVPAVLIRLLEERLDLA